MAERQSCISVFESFGVCLPQERSARVRPGTHWQVSNGKVVAKHVRRLRRSLALTSKWQHEMGKGLPLLSLQEGLIPLCLVLFTAMRYYKKEGAETQRFCMRSVHFVCQQI